MITGTEPPSTLHAAPATYEARSEHRKTIASAISETSASRPNRRDSESSAAFATEYSGIWPLGRLAALEQTFTTRPQPRSAIAGMAARIARIGAITLSSHAASQSSSGTSWSARLLAVPSLLTSTSRPPNGSDAAATMRSPASGSVTSSTSTSAGPPAAKHRPSASSSRSAERPTSTTRAPSPQSRCAAASPMPRLAPVTTHALPSSPRSISPAASLDSLDPVGDRDLGLLGEEAVDGALAGDHAKALELVVAEVGPDAERDLERARRRRVAVIHVDVDLDLAQLPALAVGVHLRGDGRARRERGSDGAGGGGPGVA